jgi:hypothetical protein
MAYLQASRRTDVEIKIPFMKGYTVTKTGTDDTGVDLVGIDHKRTVLALAHLSAKFQARPIDRRPGIAPRA